MNIEIFEDIILNTVLIVFPILVYLVLVCYKNDINKKEDMTYNAEDDYYICAYGIWLFTYSFFFCFTLTSPAKPTVPKL